MTTQGGETQEPNAEALMRLAIESAIEDCYDVDCDDCLMSAPTPCDEHLDLDVMIEKASVAALDILAHVLATQASGLRMAPDEAVITERGIEAEVWHDERGIEAEVWHDEASPQ